MNQNDIKYAEGEALAFLLSRTNNQVEINEMIANSTFDINEVSAFVVPESRIVMKGGKYSAKIVAATIDPTLNPTVYVGGRQLKDGLYEFACNSTGVFDYSGYINVPRTDGGVHHAVPPYRGERSHRAGAGSHHRHALHCRCCQDP